MFDFGRSSSLTISVVQRGQSLAVKPGDEIVTVAAEPAILVLPSLDSQTAIELDGLAVRAVRQGNSSILSVDFSRSVGFHYLRLGRNVVSFATEDAKSKLNGVLNMLSVIERNGLSFGKQLFFADGSSINDLRADFTWLTRWLLDIADTIEDVGRKPSVGSDFRRRRTDRLGSRLDITETIQMLRRNRHLLEASASGIVSAYGRRYQPRFVVVRETETATDTIENRRAVALALRCISLAKVLISLRSAQVRSLATSVARLSAALRMPTFKSLVTRPATLSARTPAEMFDPRYAFLYARYTELLGGRWGDPTDRLNTLSSFVKHSDEIYQAFVAVVLARALDLEQLHDALAPRRSEPSFAAAGLSMFYDTEPTGVATTWRSETTRPDHARPDLVLVDDASGAFLILDAKYRNDDDAASADSLTEVQYYLNTFGVSAAVVCYPPKDAAFLTTTTLQARGQELLELPISPVNDIVDLLRRTATPILADLLRRQMSGGTKPAASAFSKTSRSMSSTAS